MFIETAHHGLVQLCFACNLLDQRAVQQFPPEPLCYRLRDTATAAAELPRDGQDPMFHRTPPRFTEHHNLRRTVFAGSDTTHCEANQSKMEGRGLVTSSAEFRAIIRSANCVMERHFHSFVN